jgi:glycerol-3-phosphate dehydrogenase
VTPFEPEWEGFVTLEISNTTPLPAKIYANEGIAQVIFFESDEVVRDQLRGPEGEVPGAGGGHCRPADPPLPVTAPFPPFGAAARAEHLRALSAERWDVLVVGGGITGAATARDAAGRGLRVALVEAGDLARGTSSRSSRLIHGGIRYLETFELGLVFEASSERRRLLSELAPHLVHPLPFLFPVYRGDPVGIHKLRAGMWLYDALALFRNIARHRMLGPRAVAEAEPGLRADGLRGAALYHDAAVDDARLTVANARGAHEAGAAVVPYAPVVGLLQEGGAVHGARVRDALNPAGAEVEVRARTVLNATGPWCDEVRRLADPSVAPRLRPRRACT